MCVQRKRKSMTNASETCFFFLPVAAAPSLSPWGSPVSFSRWSVNRWAKTWNGTKNMPKKQKITQNFGRLIWTTHKNRSLYFVVFVFIINAKFNSFNCLAGFRSLPLFLLCLSFYTFASFSLNGLKKLGGFMGALVSLTWDISI